jgi:glycosyltransferase involved in cell wall biosynthesis
MKIHFSNVNFSSNSGPNSFGGRLAHELAFMGHEIVSEKEAYDSMLVFIEPASRPKPFTRVVQRLDGIWFKPEQFHTHNMGIKWAYDNSDHVIWQSEFDKKMTSHHWGNRLGTVIHNGIPFKNVDITIPDVQTIRNSYEYMFVCSSNWHRQKRLKENIDLFFDLKNTYPDSCLVVMGENSGYPFSHEDIFYMGSVPHETCLQVFSAADWMIHLAWLDHCPNVVVEALSQGCPVICTDSGGTKEIVRDNGIVIPETLSYGCELADYDRPYRLSIPSLELPKIEVDNSYLNIKKVAQKYIRVLRGDSA